MSFGAFVHQDKQERERHQREYAERCDRSDRQRRELIAWVATVVPECVDPGWGPCPLVVGRAATMRYQRGRLRPSELRAEVARRWPHWFEDTGEAA